MEAELFATTLDAFCERAPFDPFTVELHSGKTITVDHPEALVYRDGLAVYVAPGGKPSIFDHDAVTRLTLEAGSESEAF